MKSFAKTVVLLAAVLATSHANKLGKPKFRDLECTTPEECEAFALAWLNSDYEPVMRALLQNYVQKDWEYSTNLNDETSAASVAASEMVASFEKDSWEKFISQFDTSTFVNRDLARRIDLMSVLGVPALDEAKLKEYNQIVSKMQGIYGAGKVCPYDNQKCDVEKEGLTLEPGLEAIMSNVEESSYKELTYVWDEWRKASGRKYREDYIKYIGINNEAAAANNLKDASVLWLQSYTDDLNADEDFKADIEDIWQKVKPLYTKLHAYVRSKYREHWGSNYTGSEDGPIPAHLSGNMWTQQWHNSYSIVAPFPEVPNPLEGVDQALEEQGYTPRKIFELSNSFYKALGLADMTMCFDTPCVTENTEVNHQCVANNPMIEKPDWDVVCHASAWDMYNIKKDDYRIKMCTEVNFDDLVTVHHEMGHIQYFIQYVDYPLQFRDGANPGFHEAIGDTMALAVQTPIHLKSINLLDEVPNSKEADINYLMKSAMERVMFLPFAYTIDQFRWRLFDGTINNYTTMNEEWWKLREEYQGITPPVLRYDDDFDAGAKYHVAADVPYIRYFVAHILEYSFYKEMCLASKNYDPNDAAKPLFKCDFSAGPDAPKAGALLKKMLQAGRSKPWPEILEETTGSRKIDASAILEYFKPLSDWLDDELANKGIKTDWTRGHYKKMMRTRV